MFFLIGAVFSDVPPLSGLNDESKLSKGWRAGAANKIQKKVSSCSQRRREKGTKLISYICRHWFLQIRNSTVSQRSSSLTSSWLDQFLFFYPILAFR
jgi:hypothetical protein